MVEIYDPDDNDEMMEEDDELDLNPATAPQPVGVYERPDKPAGPSMGLIIGIMAILLVLSVVFYIFVLQ